MDLLPISATAPVGRHFTVFTGVPLNSCAHVINVFNNFYCRDLIVALHK